MSKVLPILKRWYWPFVLLGIGLLEKTALIEVETEFRFWSLAHLLLNSIIIYYLIFVQRQKEGFPFIPLIALFNIIQYALPVYYIKREDFQLGILQVEGLSYSFYCFACFFLMYFLLGRSKLKTPKVVIVPIVNLLQIKVVAYIFLIIIILSKLTNESALSQLAITGLYFYIGVNIFLFAKKRLLIVEQILLIVVIVSEVIVRSLSGLIAPMAMVLFFLVLSFIRAKVKVGYFVLPLIFFLWFYSSFSGVKATYREMVWLSGTDYSLTDRVQLINDLIKEKEFSTVETIEDSYKGKESALWRFSYQPSALSYVSQKTPSEIPYWGGETYIPLFSKFIPRFIWSDKPSEGLGNLFGQRYGILRSTDLYTSMNTPIVTELYVNFGLYAIFIGGFILGALFYFLNSWFNIESSNIYNDIAGMAIIFPLVVWESNFSLLFGSLILIIVAYKLIFKFLNF